jgi:hypothetical protein
MRIENKNGIIYLYPDPGKLLARTGETTGSTLMILGKSDKPDNYTEIDELAEGLPEEPVEEPDPPYEVIPDENGKIDYETAMKMKNDIDLLKQRTLSLQETNAALLQRIQEAEIWQK